MQTLYGPLGVGRRIGDLWLVSLLDMIRCAVQRYFNLGYFIGSECGNVLGIVPLGQGPLTDVQKLQQLHFLANLLMPEVQSAGLHMTAGLVSSLVGDIQNIPGLEQERVAEKLRTIRVLMQNELTERWFIGLPQDAAALFEKPETFFRDAFAAFPSAQEDMRNACKAYAVELANACVHHCMGILQVGLNDLAARLGISASMELENWKNIIDRVEAKIREIEKEPKGPTKDEKLRFSSAAALQFRYFKDAWRNHVEHHRSQYDQYTARSVLEHTRDFMGALATNGTAK